MDMLKEAFSKIKKDIEFLNFELDSLKKDTQHIKNELIKVCEIALNLDKKLQIYEENAKKTQKHREINTNNQKSIKYVPTHQHIKQTFPIQIPTHPTHDLPLKALKSPKKAFSNGNEGVPTDRQTDQQTDTPLEKRRILMHINPLISYENSQKNEKNLIFEDFSVKNQNLMENQANSVNPIDSAAKILDSLDSIKREIRLKFKRLTNQEMSVFSTLYQLEEQQGQVQVDYKVLAQRLKLTESSIRDYIRKLIKKGIPIEKKRINNKTIALSISENLKKITTLTTILQLRDL